MAELAAKYEAHPTQIAEWKKQLLDTMPDVFSGGNAHDWARGELLCRQIGQLQVDLD